MGVAELAESIREVGLIQPIVVRPVGEVFEVIAGHRRLLACRSIPLDPVPCAVLDGASDGDTMAARLHENLYRQDMTPVEEAVTYAELFEHLGDVDKVASMVHRSRDVVERRLALLSGDELVRTALHEKKISAGVAEELNKIAHEQSRRYLLEHAISDGATVSKVREWRRSFVLGEVAPVPAPEGEQPAGPVAAGLADPNRCWLCGSDEDQHDLRVRLVHQSCERVARRMSEQQLAQGVSDGSA